jgi:predicted amidohydrolase
MSKRPARIGLVQMSMASSKDSNLSKAVKMICEAADRGASVVCLPELFATRYFPTEREAHPRPETVPGPTTARLSEEAKRDGVVLVGGSILERSGAKSYNTSVVFSEKGAILGKYRKVHLPQDEHYYEQSYFSPGDRYTVVETSVGRIGVLVCFDQWYPEAARINRLMGAQILFYPTAIGWLKDVEPVEGDWKQAWESVQVGHAISNSLVVCAVNRVGFEEGTTFWGGSFVCNQFGKVLFRAGDEEGVFVVECDLGLQDTVEDGWGFLRNRRKKTYLPLME